MKPRAIPSATEKVTGKHREVSASLYALFVIFVAKFIFL